ncbi:trimeric LpxA-like protein [Parasitella parasitica]|nr:trimeric LpxA-like protein [Parasitella parasitica]
MTTQQEKSEKQKMMAGEWYHPGHKELCDDRQHCQELLKQYNNLPNGEERTQVARKIFGSYGEKSFINPAVKCDYGYNIFIGKNVEINYDCVFLDIGKIVIEDHVFMGPGVHIYAVNHPLDPTQRKTGLEIGKDVTVGNGVWIGGGAIICPGVTIGAGTTIGAGSVVTKNIPANVLAVGNPCKVIKEITPS